MIHTHIFIVYVFPVLAMKLLKLLSISCENHLFQSIGWDKLGSGSGGVHRLFLFILEKLRLYPFPLAHYHFPLLSLCGIMIICTLFIVTNIQKAALCQMLWMPCYCFQYRERYTNTESYKLIYGYKVSSFCAKVEIQFFLNIKTCVFKKARFIEV